MEASHLAKYLEPTRCSAEDAVVLGIKTIKGAPARPTAAIRVAIGGVHEKTVALQDVVLERMRSSPESLVPLNNRLSNGWMGLAESLGALTRLDGTEVAARAALMRRTLFPRGTGFVKGSHAGEWTIGEGVLKLVAKKKLEPEILALVGDHYLPFIREAHSAFGEGLGVGAGESIEEALESNALSTALTAFVKALAEYGRVMAGWVDLNDPKKIAVFKKAMAPLDAHRRKLAAQGGSVVEEDDEEEVEEVDDGEDVGPGDPVPPVDAGEDVDSET